MAEERVVAHSSDLHIGRDGGDRGIGGLRDVVRTASGAGAHVLVLAGDVFDHNRVPAALLASFADVVSGADFCTVILPGNHDPLLDDSPYRRLPALPRLHVIGLASESIALPELALQIRGLPHRTYDDMHPLPPPDEPRTRDEMMVVVAHGHYVSGPSDLHRAWLIRDEDIAALGADYVALGHWDRRERVGRAPSFAYYSGSPDLAKSINIARLRDGPRAEVSVRSLEDGSETAA